MSGFSRSSHSTTCSSRARIPFTFQVTTFMTSAREPLPEPPRKLGRGSLVLVLEEDVGLGPGRLREACRPRAGSRPPVVLPAQAQVAPCGRGHERRRAFVVVGDAEGGAGGAQQREDFLVEPGGVAKLERGLEIGRQEREERIEPRQVFFKVRRPPEKERPATAAEGPGAAP